MSKAILISIMALVAALVAQAESDKTYTYWVVGQNLDGADCAVNARTNPIREKIEQNGSQVWVDVGEYLQRIEFVNNIRETQGGWSDDSIINFGWTYNAVTQVRLNESVDGDNLVLSSPDNMPSSFQIILKGVTEVTKLNEARSIEVKSERFSGECFNRN